MTLIDAIKSVREQYGEGVYHMRASQCCNAPFEVFMDTRASGIVVACRKCEQPRMVFNVCEEEPQEPAS